MVVNKNQLEKMYIQKKLTTRQIAKIFRISHVTIINYAKKYDIKLRNKSEMQTGKKFSKETKDKMRKAKIGYIPWNKGKTDIYSEEYRQKISNSLLNKCGNLARNWQGGKSFEPYSILFNDKLKEKIRFRDNYKCQNCDTTQENHIKLYNQRLHIHHIDYDKMNCNEYNLIALCLICNVKANQNRDYWKQYYMNKIASKEDKICQPI